MIPRVLEPELMDTAEDAHQYDTMDHSIVNGQFASDLLVVLMQGGWGRATASPQRSATNILDLGAGTAQIPIELARRAPNVRITAVDASQSMLALAGENIPLPFREGQGEGSPRIDLILADAKHLPFTSGSFPVVISNSIIHHIADPQTVLAEAFRAAMPGGLQFHRDLVRPDDETQLAHLVETYAAGCTPYQRKLFADSLRAALSLEEIKDVVVTLGFAPETVQMTSDRHWTWIGTTKAG